MPDTPASGFVVFRRPFSLRIPAIAITCSDASRSELTKQSHGMPGWRRASCDYLAAIIRMNYAESARPPATESHIQHVRRFLRWFSESRDCTLLDGVAFLRVETAEGFHQADMVYLDMPFVQSGLSRIYSRRVRGRDRQPLWSGYAKLKRQDFLTLLKAVGVEDALCVKQTRIPVVSQFDCGHCHAAGQTPLAFGIFSRQASAQRQRRQHRPSPNTLRRRGQCNLLSNPHSDTLRRTASFRGRD